MLGLQPLVPVSALRACQRQRRQSRTARPTRRIPARLPHLHYRLLSHLTRRPLRRVRRPKQPHNVNPAARAQRARAHRRRHGGARLRELRMCGCDARPYCEYDARDKGGSWADGWGALRGMAL